MGNWTKKLLVLLLAVSIALGLMACGGKEGNTATGAQSKPTEATAKIKDVINIAMSAEPGVYDLQKTTSNVARVALCGTVYEQLVTLNSKSEPVPELCEKYDVNADATEFTFYLRKGVKFHDGSEMKASDVAASLNRWIENYSDAKACVKDARFTAVDDYTVSIKTKNPSVTLLYLLAAGSQRAVITTAAATKDLDDKGNMKQIIGTGPYKFSEWVLDQYVKLDKFDDYVPYGDPNKPSDGWAGYKHAYAKQIVLWVVPEESTRISGLMTVQYDYANITDATLSTAKNAENLKVLSEEGGQAAVVFNKKEGLGADINMRKAVNSIIDSDESMVVSYGSSYKLDSSYMEPNQPLWYSEAGSENYNKKDFEAAKKYLQAAGYNGQTVRILAASANNFNKIAEIIQKELEAQNIKCDLTVVDWATFTKYRTDPSKYDLFISSYAAVPVPSLKAYFGSGSPGWTNDQKLNDLWTQYNNAKTLDEAAQVWGQIQSYCWDYLPIINLGHYVSNDAFNAKMQGVIYQNGPYFWNAYIPE